MQYIYIILSIAGAVIMAINPGLVILPFMLFFIIATIVSEYTHTKPKSTTENHKRVKPDNISGSKSTIRKLPPIPDWMKDCELEPKLETKPEPKLEPKSMPKPKFVFELEPKLESELELEPSYNPVPDFSDYISVDNTGIYMSAEAKLEYLRSPRWHELKQSKLSIVGGKCEACGSFDELHCHHVNYSRLGAEKLSDLAILCCDCHSLLHENAKLKYGNDGYGGMSRNNLYPLSLIS